MKMHSNSKAAPKFLTILSIAVYAVFAILAELGAVPAWAADRDMMPISISGGITHSGASTSLYENPAGLSGITNLSVSGQVGGTAGTQSSPDITGALEYGNDIFGLAVGVQHTGTPQTNLVYGLGIYASPIKTSIGVAGTTPMSPSGDSNFNAGVQIGLAPMVDFGFDAMGLNGGPSEFGFGLAYHLAPMAMLVADFAGDKSFGNLAAQPGIAIGNSMAALTVSYGFAFSGDVMESQISDGFSVGGAVALGHTVALQLYFRHIMKYYAALTIGF